MVYLRRVYEGGHRGKYFPRQKGALFTLALFGAKVKAITLAVPKVHYGLERL